MSYTPGLTVPFGPLQEEAASTQAANTAYWFPYRLRQDTVINRLGCYIDTSSGNLDLGILADSAGAPGTLLVSTGSTASPGTGKREFTVTATTIPAGIIWFASGADNTTFSRRYCQSSASPSIFDPITNTFLFPLIKTTSYPLAGSPASPSIATLMFLQWANFV